MKRMFRGAGAIAALFAGLDPEVAKLMFGSPPPQPKPEGISEKEFEEYNKILRKESKLSANQRERLKNKVERFLKQIEK